MNAGRRPVVAVVGAGIAGMSAAWELATADHGGSLPPEVHLFDASPELGGSLRSAEFAGRTVDLAADAFVARRPEGADLCAELGLTSQLVPVGARGASVWGRGRLRPLPDGLHLGVPTRWWPLARSGILGPAESLAAAADLVKPHRGARGIVGDQAVGAIVSDRLGRPVSERLVDPLVGGINAGDVDELSAAATFPYLLAAAMQSGSLMRQLRRGLPRPGSGAAADAPLFWSLPTGTAGLAGALAAQLPGRGVHVSGGVSVDALGRRPAAGTGPPGWRLRLRGDHPGPGHPPSRREILDADGVVLAVPAGPTAGLLADLAPEAAGLLRTIAYASVAIITLALPADGVGARLSGTGFLVPRTAVVDGSTPLVTAATYLGRKWPHLARPGDELVRVSVGRFEDSRHCSLGDGELVDAVVGELTHLIDLRAVPLDAMVSRHDQALPQYRVGHLIRVASIEAAVAGLEGIELAGAAYRGVGIPACIAGGRQAARRLLDSLSQEGGTAWASSVAERP